jgi:3-dehydroquinate synthase
VRLPAPGAAGPAAPLQFRFGGFITHVLFSSEPVLPSSESFGTLWVFDRHTFALVGRRFGVPAAKAVILPAGEASKSWPAAQRVLRAALRAGLGRDGRIVGVGGGVVCDLAAFTASLYMRGCRLTLVPTTLLAMVDAALGGKTAVNLGGSKNIAGSFYPADEIRVWSGALASLPVRELLSGLGEAIKTALLGDATLLSFLQDNREQLLARDPTLLEEVVRRCLAVKGAIVAEDFQESGRRAVLNLGHTFAHALEAVTRMRRLSHGEAVAWGLARAAELARSLGLADAEYVGRVRSILEAFGFALGPVRGASPAAIFSAMHSDKKKRGGRLRLVLQRGIGDTVVQEVEAEAILRTLRDNARDSA